MIIIPVIICCLGGGAINKRFVFLCLKNCSKNENDRCMSRNIKIDVE